MAGSLEKRGQDTWRLVVSDGFNPDGSRRKFQKTIKATTKREASKELEKFAAEVRSGRYTGPSKMTLKQFAEYWVREHAELNLAPKTVHEYKQLLKRITKDLGHIKLDEVKPLHLNEWYNKLQTDGGRADGKPGRISGNTANHYHRLLSSMLKCAVQWQLISSNPTDNVRPPKIKKKPTTHYNEEQIAALLSALEEEPLKYRAMIHVALASGMRRGELMGLQWDDVDFSRRIISIRRAHQYVPGIGSLTKDPKTETSVREVHMPASTIEILKALLNHQNDLKEAYGELWKDSNRLFTADQGSPLHPDTPSKWFREFLERHKLPPMPFHGLRHTSATILINKGVNVRSVSARLGHATSSTTMNIYAHALKSVDQQAADVMEDLHTLTKQQEITQK